MTDVFHKNQSEPLTDHQKQLIAALKDKAQELYDLIAPLEQNREEVVQQRLDTAARRLEEAVMWAVKAVTYKP